MLTVTGVPCLSLPAVWKASIVTATGGELPAAVPLTRRIPLARTPGTALMSAVQASPAGNRAGSRLESCSRTVVPSQRASPAAGNRAETLGSSPANRESTATRRLPMHTPAVHVSSPVRGFPSLQGNVFGVCPQPVTVLQESVVHTLPSSQFVGACTQPVAGT